MAVSDNQIDAGLYRLEEAWHRPTAKERRMIILPAILLSLLIMAVLLWLK